MPRTTCSDCRSHAASSSIGKTRHHPANPVGLCLTNTSDERIVCGQRRQGFRSKQFTKSEKDAVHTLRKELRNVHGGFKRTFPQGSPQWKEVHIGEKDNNSTARLLIYSADTAKAWEKYKSVLTAKGRLVQADVDAMTAAAAVLQSTDTTQETAKSVDTRDATAKKNQAKQIVLTTADSIYNAIEREFHNDTATLAKFAAIKELRFTPDVAEEEEPAPKPTTANQTADTSKSTSVVK